MNNGGGSGWKKEGMDMFKKLCFDVRRNRKMADPKFNEELLKLYRERRQRRSGKDDRVATRRKMKEIPSRCFDEFNDPDSDDDDEEQESHNMSNAVKPYASFVYHNEKEDSALTGSQGTSSSSIHEYLQYYQNIAIKKEKV